MNIRPNLLILLLTLNVAISGIDARAQKNVNCDDPAVTAQADALKQGMLKKGMVVFRESPLKMASMEPTAVVVRLLKGKNYQLVFVGSENASRLTMELFDGNNKLLDEKRVRGSNYIVYTFKPAKTDDYLITLYQKKGIRDFCGYFGVMMPNSKTAAPAVRQQPKTTPARYPAAGSKGQQPNSNRTKATREAQQGK